MKELPISDPASPPLTVASTDACVFIHQHLIINTSFNLFRKIPITNDNLIFKDLVKDLKGELSGVFQTTCVMLSYATHEFLAIELHDAMAGIGCDQASMTEILMSRSNQEMENTRDFYATSMI